MHYILIENPVFGLAICVFTPSFIVRRLGKLLIKRQADFEQNEMRRLKAAGKEKTATYRQYLGNRLMYNQMIALYKKYGLL